MADIQGVYHPTDDAPYRLTGAGAGDGDLGELALTAGQKALDASADALTAAMAYAESLEWSQGALSAGQNLNGVVEQGLYVRSPGQSALNLPIYDGSGAVLEVFRHGAGVVQRYTSMAASGQTVWVRRGNEGSPNVWFDWEQVTSRQWDRGALPAEMDLNDVVEQGLHVRSPGQDALNLPVYDNNGAVLEVFRHGVGILQRYTSMAASGKTVWIRRGTSGTPNVWFGWEQVTGDEGAARASSAPRRELLQQGLRARKGGTIGTGGRGVVALRFDDAAGDFARDVLPLLVERGLPFTRVIATDRVGNTAGGEDDTWANIQDYCLEHGGEVWNHGFNHGTANTPAIVDEQVTGALEKFRLNLPRLIVDCFAPPGGQTSGWMGYMPAETIENLTDNYAGQQIMAHHALSSGYLTNTWYHPLDGVMRDGQIFYSSDARDIPFLQTLIHRARDYPAGVTLMWHANNIDSEGYISMADFTTILDYIVSLRDAGDLLVLTVSGMAVADALSDRREDLLRTHSGASWSEQVLFPAARRQIPGSTRELTATVTGTAGATVTSVVGASTKGHTIPSSGTLLLHHPVTIPLDVTSLPVSISGGVTDDAHLMPV